MALLLVGITAELLGRDVEAPIGWDAFRAGGFIAPGPFGQILVESVSRPLCLNLVFECIFKLLLEATVGIPSFDGKLACLLVRHIPELFVLVFLVVCGTCDLLFRNHVHPSSSKVSARNCFRHI